MLACDSSCVAVFPSQDPVSDRLIDDIHAMLSMAAFGIDASMTADLVPVLGPLPAHETAFTVERVVLGGIVPVYVNALKTGFSPLLMA